MCYHKFSYFKIYATYTWTPSKRCMKILMLARARKMRKHSISPLSMPLLVTKQNSDLMNFVKSVKNKIPSHTRRYSHKNVRVTANFRKILQEKQCTYTLVNKNPSAWNFLSPKPEVTCGTVAIIIRVVLLSPYLRISALSLSSIHYNQSHHVYINRRRQYICLIWN